MSMKTFVDFCSLYSFHLICIMNNRVIFNITRKDLLCMKNNESTSPSLCLILQLESIILHEGCDNSKKIHTPSSHFSPGNGMTWYWDSLIRILVVETQLQSPSWGFTRKVSVNLCFICISSQSWNWSITWSFLLQLQKKEGVALFSIFLCYLKLLYHNSDFLIAQHF
jgi:hypothetical protein